MVARRNGWLQDCVSGGCGVTAGGKVEAKGVSEENGKRWGWELLERPGKGKKEKEGG